MGMSLLSPELVLQQIQIAKIHTRIYSLAKCVTCTIRRCLDIKHRLTPDRKAGLIIVRKEVIPKSTVLVNGRGLLFRIRGEPPLSRSPCELRRTRAPNSSRRELRYEGMPRGRPSWCTGEGRAGPGPEKMCLERGCGPPPSRWR